ncbi:MAG: nuclear transport factor 2 family protein [Saprospiraceae bacterium]|nr:nuclear transport factor 2 family protein [Saprospiraceae bacterium]
MISFRFLFLVALLPVLASAQDQEAEVKAAIMQMFDGMRAGDTSMVAAVFLPDAQLLRIGHDAEGKLKTQSASVSDFLNGLASAGDAELDEQLSSFDIRVDPPLATAWTDYTFFLNGNVHHCGINTFTLYQTAAGWKISRVEDTGHPPAYCVDLPAVNQEAVALLLDNFHKAAAEADEDTFFGSMTEDCMYLGTDAGERWLRDELREWSKEFFDRESAWAFTPTERHIYFSEDGTKAWFDELLDTWMGVCRGSGVLINTAEGWKLTQYNLAVAVPNDHIQGLIQLMQGKD